VDRRVRMPLYARAAIREAWLLDLTADRVEVYRAPTADGYQQVVRFERGQRLTPEAFPDLMVTVENLLG
jgi:Uma2 family endonuclease